VTRLACSSRSWCYAQGVERIGTRCAQRRHRARQQSHDENQQRDRAVNARIASTDIAHPRKRGGERSVDYRHYLPELARKPQAVRQVLPELLRNLGAPFPAVWERLRTAHSPREAARLLAKIPGTLETRGAAEVVPRAMPIAPTKTICTKCSARSRPDGMSRSSGSAFARPAFQKPKPSTPSTSKSPKASAPRRSTRWPGANGSPRPRI
jgi:hypothetical protein